MPVAAVAGGGRAVPVGDGGRGGRGGHRRRAVRRAAARAPHRAVALKSEKAWMKVCQCLFGGYNSSDILC